MNTYRTLALTLGMVFVLHNKGAAAVIQDGSFETPGLPAGEFRSGSSSHAPFLVGSSPWVFTSNEGFSGIISTPGLGGLPGNASLDMIPPDGNQAAFLAIAFAPAIIYQDVIIPNDGWYQLKYFVAGREGEGVVNLEVTWDGVSKESFSTTSGSGFAEHQVEFAASAGPHRLTFKASGQNWNGAFLDNVSMVDPVPEPASVGIVAVAVLLCGVASQRLHGRSRAVRA
jgi:hypothetical protein